MKTKLLIVFAFFTFNLFSQTNLIPNGGFETWTNSTTLSNWTIENNVSQNTTYFTEGNKSAQLSIANSTTKPKITAQVPMVAGNTYTVKFKYKYVNANFSGDHPISLNISQNGSATTLSSSTFATDNNWTVKETSFTPDQNMSYDLSISLYTFDAAAFNVLIDDVQVYIQATEQYTLIPDVNFENKLIALGIDSAPADGRVLTSSIDKLTRLNVSNSSISDLTGIQDFVALQSLDCQKNNLTTLDLSKNGHLTTVNCSTNKLMNLNVTKNLSLTEFYCYNNQITSLDVSQNINLAWFMCNSNEIKTIDVSNNLKLEMFDCLDNKITSLDISKNPLINELACENNQLTYLNLKNGANTILDLTYSNFRNNPNLTCILVDDVSYSNTNWSKIKDAAATYNTDCQQYTLIPDVNFENKLIALGIDSGATDGKVLTNNVNKLATLDVSSSSITDLTGIQDFSSLISLKCYGNKLTNLDFSRNTDLVYLNCNRNQLISLDVSKNLNLKELYCSENNLTLLNVSNNVALTNIQCAINKLSYLNLKNGKNILLKYQNSALYISSNPNLYCILVDDVTYSNANWTYNKDAIAIYSSTCNALGLEKSAFDKITIYPNPTTGELHIDNIILKKATVYNALGKLVKTTTFTSGTNDNTIHLTGLTKGIYYVYLESADANTAKKIIVE